MKTTTKTQSILTAALCAAAMLASGAFAGTWTYDAGAQTLTHSDTDWVLYAYNNAWSGETTNLTINGVISQPGLPSALPLNDAIIGGGTITEIGFGAFFGCSGLTAVNIPDSVASIGDGAFSWCYGLTSISVSADNPVYSSAGGVMFSKDGTELILYPLGKAGPLTIPDSVTSIGDYAFSGCTGLTAVAIPDSVTNIGSSAFNNCSGLTSVTLGNSVTSIGNYAFSLCSGLTGISVSEANAAYCDIDGVVFSKDKKTLVFYPSGRQGSYVIPDSVTSIGDGAFYWCTGLTGTLTIPGSVTSIGEGAFDACGLKTVLIGRGVTGDLWDTGLLYCGSLESITVAAGNPAYSSVDGMLLDASGTRLIRFPAGRTGAGAVPEGITSIGSDAFCGGDVYYLDDWGDWCGDWASPALQILTLPSTLESLDDYDWMFDELQLSLLTVMGAYLWDDYFHVNATEIAVAPGHAASWEPYLDDGSFAAGDALYQGIPIRTTAQRYEFQTLLSETMFFGNGGSEWTFTMTVPEGVFLLRASVSGVGGDYSELYIENDAGNWGDGICFYGDEANASFIFPEPGEYTVYFYSERAYGGASLKIEWTAKAVASETLMVNPPALILGAGAGSAAFMVSSGAAWTVTDNADWLDVSPAPGTGSGIVTVKAPANASPEPRTATVTISDGGLTRTVSVTQSGAASSGFWTYDDGDGYNGTITHSDTGWVLYVYASGDDLRVQGIAAQPSTPSALPLNDRIIGGYRITEIYGAFRNCTVLTSVTLPDNVYDYRAFRSCTSLVNLFVSADHKMYKSINGILFSKDEKTLLSYPVRRTGAYVIPDTVTSIGNDAFSECYYLTSVSIGSGVTSIGEEAFYACASLTSVDIPDNVTDIGERAFEYCVALTEAMIGTGVETIGGYAFEKCQKLASVTFRGTCPDILYNGSARYGDWTFPWGTSYDDWDRADYGRGIYGATGWVNDWDLWGNPYTPNVVTYIYPAHAASWVPRIFGGPVENGQAYWEGRPIRLAGDPPPASLTASPSSVSLGAGAGSQSFSVSGNVSWSVTDNAAWLTVSPASGSGNRSVTVTAEANTGTASRNATVTVTGGGITRTVSVTQSGTGSAPPSPQPSPDDRYLAAAESSAFADITPVTTTAYAGFLYDTDGAILGTLTVTAKEAKGVWSYTAKATLLGTSISFSLKGTAPGGTLTIPGKFGETLTVTLGADTFSGTLAGGKVGGTFRIAGARDAFADKKDATGAAGRLNDVRGYYTAALIDSSDAATAGYLTLTVGNGGSVKFAGKLADATAISGSAKLLEGLNDNKWFCISLHKPLYSKKGSIGGLLWLSPSDKVLRVDTASDWFIDWTSDNSKNGTFNRALDICGGYFSDGKASPATAPSYLFSADIPDDLPLPAADASWVTTEYPQGVDVESKNGKLMMQKGTTPKKPVRDALTPDYTYDALNPSCATIGYTAKTGIFKGGFKLYYAGDSARGLLHKSVSVSYTGVLTPVRDEEAFAGLPPGLGTGTVTINRQKYGIAVELR